MFQVAKSETGNGLDACGGCELLPTKPGIADDSIADEVESLVWQTEQIIDEQNAGFATDWDFHEPELFELVIAWRHAEKQLNMLFSVRHQQFIKAHFKNE